MEIDAYLFEHKLLTALGGQAYLDIFERKVLSFQWGQHYNPNCLNADDLQNAEDLKNVFGEEISLSTFNVNAYLTFLSRQSTGISGRRSSAIRISYNFAKLYLVELRGGCINVAHNTAN